ncbi:hypothetical protein GTO89_16335 [Heliobacterium gestii]|uniref:Uncharacterized protein YyaB-like PH domain-containing protein n=1 Tax=Heliomicrobium gestii TaxID=2699 RepID=A0A845LJ59_HELGE|nr:PH domain-containing protein [Heliomicrobium gestii]MBM7868474.1 hypothetical protein [Heliomicrobium gestii]MZP44599.1 hypothetical protein [Heliomicrobium gestii]
MYYNSKHDYSWSFYSISGIVLVLLVEGVLEHNPITTIIGIIMALVYFWRVFSTGYYLKDTALTVKSGPFRKTIDYREISRIKKVRDVISFGYALSEERLEIVYGNHEDYVLISPNMEEDFLRELKKRCPQIAGWPVK